LLVRGAILRTITRDDPDRYAALFGARSTARGALPTANRTGPTRHGRDLPAASEEAGAVIPGSNHVVVELTVAAATVAAGRVSVVASLIHIDRSVAAQAFRILQLTTRTAAVSIDQVSVVAPLRIGDDAVATNRVGG
jgi:hypothetical protein